MNRFRKKRLMMGILFVAMLFAVSAVVMLLWNALLPEITGVKKLSYWQAMGVFVLAKILFGGFRPGQCRNNGPSQNITDEHREKFRELMRERFSGYCKK